ncbi:Universal stress protein A-like protein [Bienertia sinuspersici]
MAEGGGGGRRIGVAMDFSECSKKALKWALDDLARSGDYIILIDVRPQRSYESGEMQLWESTGSPLIPYGDFSNPATMKKYGVEPDAETLDMVKNVAHDKEVVPLMKIFWGDPRVKLCEAVDNIPLNCLVIGCRGLGPLKRVLLGSVSKHVMNNATCPVTVVH